MGCHYSKTAVVELTTNVSEENVDAEKCELLVHEFNSSNKTNKKTPKTISSER